MHFFIHSYPNTILRFLFVIRLAEKLYKISHALSMGGRNAGGIPYISLIKNSTLSTWFDLTILPIFPQTQ